MLRVVISLGLFLMLAGFGMAGWQLLQTGKPAADLAATAPQDVQPDLAISRLISPTGSPVNRADLRAYLLQDHFVESRTVIITRTAQLADLLEKGETLPDNAYLEVLSDIRAPKVAGKACDVLLETLAAECAVNSARVVEGSVDAAAGKAQFRLELVYRLKPAETALPDLAEYALAIETLNISIDPASGLADTADDLLRASAEAALSACADPSHQKACRVLRLDLIWRGKGAGVARAEVGWLKPLPKGMFPVAPLG